ncbi:hypothetical protein Moror_11012, partial [Moniliophthora roreri MCA 2997]
MAIHVNCKIFTNTSQNLLVHAVLLLISAIFYGAQAILLFIVVITTCKRETMAVPISRAQIYPLVMAIIMMIVTTEIVVFIIWDIVQVQPSVILGNLSQDRIMELEGWVIKGLLIGVFSNWGLCYVLEVLGIVEIQAKDGLFTRNPTALFISTISFIGCFAKEDPSRLQKCESVRILAIALTIGTNIAITASIWHYAWLHWKAVHEYLEAGNRHAHSEKTLVLVLESGVIYIIIQIIFVTLLLLTNNMCNRSFAWRLAAAIIEITAISLV